MMKKLCSIIIMFLSVSTSFVSAFNMAFVVSAIADEGCRTCVEIAEEESEWPVVQYCAEPAVVGTDNQFYVYVDKHSEDPEFYTFDLVVKGVDISVGQVEPLTPNMISFTPDGKIRVHSTGQFIIHGDPATCSGLNSEDSCNQANCEWYDAYCGDPDCLYDDKYECESAADCSWDYYENHCYNILTECSEIESSPICTTNLDCAWQEERCFEPEYQLKLTSTNKKVQLFPTPECIDLVSFMLYVQESGRERFVDVKNPLESFGAFITAGIGATLSQVEIMHSNKGKEYETIIDDLEEKNSILDKIIDFNKRINEAIDAEDVAVLSGVEAEINAFIDSIPNALGVTEWSDLQKDLYKMYMSKAEEAGDWYIGIYLDEFVEEFPQYSEEEVLENLPDIFETVTLNGALGGEDISEAELEALKELFEVETVEEILESPLYKSFKDRTLIETKYEPTSNYLYRGNKGPSYSDGVDTLELIKIYIDQDGIGKQGYRDPPGFFGPGKYHEWGMPTSKIPETSLSIPFGVELFFISEDGSLFVFKKNAMEKYTNKEQPYINPFVDSRQWENEVLFTEKVGLSDVEHILVRSDIREEILSTLSDDPAIAEKFGSDLVIFGDKPLEEVLIPVNWDKNTIFEKGMEIIFYINSDLIETPEGKIKSSSVLSYAERNILIDVLKENQKLIDIVRTETDEVEVSSARNKINSITKNTISRNQLKGTYETETSILQYRDLKDVVNEVNDLNKKINQAIDEKDLDGLIELRDDLYALRETIPSAIGEVKWTNLQKDFHDLMLKETYEKGNRENLLSGWLSKFVKDHPEYEGITESQLLSQLPPTAEVRYDGSNRPWIKITEDSYSGFLYRGNYPSEGAPSAVELIARYIEEGGLMGIGKQKDPNYEHYLSTADDPTIAAHYNHEYDGSLYLIKTSSKYSSEYKKNMKLLTLSSKEDEIISQFIETRFYDKVKFADVEYVLVSPENRIEILQTFGEDTVLFGNKPLKDVVLDVGLDGTFEDKWVAWLNKIVEINTGLKEGPDGRLKSYKILTPGEFKVVESTINKNIRLIQDIIESQGELTEKLEIEIKSTNAFTEDTVYMAQTKTASDVGHITKSLSDKGYDVSSEAANLLDDAGLDFIEISDDVGKTLETPAKIKMTETLESALGSGMEGKVSWEFEKPIEVVPLRYGNLVYGGGLTALFAIGPRLKELGDKTNDATLLIAADVVQVGGFGVMATMFISTVASQGLTNGIIYTLALLVDPINILGLESGALAIDIPGFVIYIIAYAVVNYLWCAEVDPTSKACGCSPNPAYEKAQLELEKNNVNPGEEIDFTIYGMQHCSHTQHEECPEMILDPLTGDIVRCITIYDGYCSDPLGGQGECEEFDDDSYGCVEAGCDWHEGYCSDIQSPCRYNSNQEVCTSDGCEWDIYSRKCYDPISGCYGYKAGYTASYLKDAKTKGDPLEALASCRFEEENNGTCCEGEYKVNLEEGAYEVYGEVQSISFGGGWKPSTDEQILTVGGGGPVLNSIPLKQGYNLISTPYSTVTFDTSDCLLHENASHYTGAPYEKVKIEDMEGGVGYWVYSYDDSCEVELSDYSNPIGPPTEFEAGWNQIAIPLEGLHKDNVQCDQIEDPKTWNTETESWVFVENMVPGKSYFVDCYPEHS